MKFYKLTYVLEDEYVEKLAAMAERYKNDPACFQKLPSSAGSVRMEFILA